MQTRLLIVSFGSLRRPRSSSRQSVKCFVGTVSISPSLTRPNPCASAPGNSATVCLGKGLMAGPVARILHAQQSTSNLRLAVPSSDQRDACVIGNKQVTDGPQTPDAQCPYMEKKDGRRVVETVGLWLRRAIG